MARASARPDDATEQPYRASTDVAALERNVVMYETPDSTLLPAVGVAAVATGLDALLVVLVLAVLMFVLYMRRARHDRAGRDRR